MYIFDDLFLFHTVQVKRLIYKFSKAFLYIKLKKVNFFKFKLWNLKYTVSSKNKVNFFKDDLQFSRKAIEEKGLKFCWRDLIYSYFLFIPKFINLPSWIGLSLCNLCKQFTMASHWQVIFLQFRGGIMVCFVEQYQFIK